MFKLSQFINFWWFPLYRYARIRVLISVSYVICNWIVFNDISLNLVIGLESLAYVISLLLNKTIRKNQVGMTWAQIKISSSGNKCPQMQIVLNLFSRKLWCNLWFKIPGPLCLTVRILLWAVGNYYPRFQHSCYQMSLDCVYHVKYILYFLKSRYNCFLCILLPRNQLVELFYKTPEVTPMFILPLKFSPNPVPKYSFNLLLPNISAAGCISIKANYLLSWKFRTE